VTPKQRGLLTFIEVFIREHGFAPSYAEIAAGLKKVSRSGMSQQVAKLVEGGFLVRGKPHCARALYLPGEVPAGLLAQSAVRVRHESIELPVIPTVDLLDELMRREAGKA
jgi:SOS-response transcriptional repressor LexA